MRQVDFGESRGEYGEGGVEVDSSGVDFVGFEDEALEGGEVD